METFGPAPHESVLLLLVRFALLLASARCLGELAGRLGQPAVVGELAAGVLLGPSFLGRAPGLGAVLLPHQEIDGPLLEVISLLGALFLLVLTGIETDLRLMRRHARTAFGVSFGGVLVCFGFGLLLGHAMPDELLADPARRTTFMLFLATALSISAIPVIAKVLLDLGLFRRDVGQTILAAGMSDDSTGWILLSIVAGLASGQALSVGGVALQVGKVLGFLAISATLGVWLVRRLLDLALDRLTGRYQLVTVVVVLMLAWGAASQALGLEAALGAFVVGVILGHLPRLPDHVQQSLEVVSLGIFSPVFFAVAGLKVDVLALADPRILGWSAAVLAVASLGKIAGTYLGARLIGRRDHWTALAFGAGLNARGAMEIIVATIGLSLGILSREVFSMIVIMAIATSVLAPPALRWVLARVKPDAEENERLEREAAVAGSFPSTVRRVLLPVRPRQEGGEVLEIERLVLERLSSEHDVAATLLSVADGSEREAAERMLETTRERLALPNLTTKLVEAQPPGEAVLAEAQKHYDLVVLGATQRGTGERLFSPLVDELVRYSPCATLVVQGGAERAAWKPRRILVPTNGGSASRRAAELAFTLMDGVGGRVTVLHVLRPTVRGARAWRARETASEIVEDLRTLGDALGVRVAAEVRVGHAPEQVIVDAARAGSIDVVVLGTDLRPGSSRLHFGPRVERILEGAPCPVMVLNVP